MAPVKCYYHNCANTNANKSVFSFPIKDEPRLKLWIENSGNVSLVALSLQELKHRFICEDHFRPEDVFKRPPGRSRLIYKAVPMMNNSDTEFQQKLEEIPQLTPRVWDKSIKEDPAPSTSDVTVKEEQNDEYNGLAPSSPDIAVKEEDNDEEDPLASCPSPSGLSDIGSEELEGALDTPTIINLRQQIKDLRSQLKQKDKAIQSLQENEAVKELYGIIKSLQETVAEKDRIIKSVEDTNSRLLEKNNALKSVLTTIKNKLAAAKHKKCR